MPRRVRHGRIHLVRSSGRRWPLVVTAVLVVAAAVAVVLTSNALSSEADDTTGPLVVARTGATPLSVLFAGDSLTVGRDASSAATSFRSLVTNHLEASGPVRATRIGNSGRTTSEVLPAAKALTRAYDLVIVELGTNDVYLNTVPQFGVDYPAFIESIRTTSPHAALICVGTWATTPVAAQDDQIIRSTCEQAGGRFVPISRYKLRQGYVTPKGEKSWDSGRTDGTHPSDLGHAAIAKAIDAQLRITG